jgi:hypothetical protein
MSLQKKMKFRLLAALAVTGCLVTGLAAPTLAQSGLTIFSGVERENQLNYRTDNGGQPGMRDRYYFRIPPRKMELAVSELLIAYPESYGGEFDPEAVRVRVNDDEVALDEVNWDPDNRVIEIYPTEQIPAATRVEIVLSNVRNPRRSGIHYFNALVRSPGDLPMSRYVGTWILDISRE